MDNDKMTNVIHEVIKTDSKPLEEEPRIDDLESEAVASEITVDLPGEELPEGAFVAAEEDDQDYVFLQEQIKEHTYSPRQRMKRLASLVASALVFGTIACATFYAVRPWMMERFKVEEKVVLSNDEIPEEETEPKPTPIEEKNEPETVIIETPREMTADDFRLMYQQMSGQANQVLRSIAMITSRTEQGVDWFQTSYANEASVSGVAIAETSSEILFLVPSASLQSGSQIQATFPNKESFNATLRKKDDNVGLAIVTVAKESLSESAKGSYSIATLGNSYGISRGEPILLVGSLFGSDSAYSYGVISSHSTQANVADTTIGMITSDVAGASNASGVIATTNGEIVGVLMPNAVGGSSSLAGYGISEIKETIERLSNGQAVPYAGLNVSTVTPAMIKQNEMPEGVYITDVKVDSPAMEAGIQKGDILKEINEEAITTSQAYRDSLWSKTPGEVISIRGYRLNGEVYEEMTFSLTVGSRE